MQRPSALGLMLCDHVIFEAVTFKPTLVGIFTGIVSSVFPLEQRPIDVFAALTDGQGRIVLDLVVTDMRDDRQIDARAIEREFANPLEIVNVCFRLRTLVFAEPGSYMFQLYAEGEPICHHRLNVRHAEGQA